MRQTVGVFILGVAAIVVGVIDVAIKWPWPWWIPASLGLVCVLAAVLMFWRSRGDKKELPDEEESQVQMPTPPPVTHSPTFIKVSDHGQANHNKLTYIAGDQRNEGSDGKND